MNVYFNIYGYPVYPSITWFKFLWGFQKSPNILLLIFCTVLFKVFEPVFSWVKLETVNIVDLIIVSVAPSDVTETWLLFVWINAFVEFTGKGLICGCETVYVPVGPTIVIVPVFGFIFIAFEVVVTAFTRLYLFAYAGWVNFAWLATSPVK